jgi:hypothetical protein
MEQTDEIKAANLLSGLASSSSRGSDAKTSPGSPRRVPAAQQLDKMTCSTVQCNRPRCVQAVPDEVSLTGNCHRLSRRRWVCAAEQFRVLY